MSIFPLFSWKHSVKCLENQIVCPTQIVTVWLKYIFYSRVKEHCGIGGYNFSLPFLLDFFFWISLSKHPVEWQENPFHWASGFTSKMITLRLQIISTKAILDAPLILSTIPSTSAPYCSHSSQSPSNLISGLTKISDCCIPYHQSTSMIESGWQVEDNDLTRGLLDIHSSPITQSCTLSHSWQ